MKIAEVFVYGAEQICASCVGMPSSKETYEWLEAALSRKFPNQPIKFTYIDIESPQEEPFVRKMAEKVRNDEYFYPLVVLDEKVLGEGNPRLKTIYEALEAKGYKSEAIK
ncbi:disulfide oxidoreductase [Pradoshia eiseniae]|uniref:Disulfide oxidoreductase n=1 Tax=Pradoshia eiseniae TaxID=2064768 RepID=A0A2S7MZC5_9BACI|nr:YuzD family protein [Pradoshia eiseniae]PQD95182.1 disulfide oxidoreductase [Pradoshia eiseniae]